ncbi:MAG: hypothetical protein V1859_02405 [archaeon]
MMTEEYGLALEILERKLTTIRSDVPVRNFNPNVPAEIEINKFWFDGQTIDRIMVVLRSTGCEHYKAKKGCSMCAHYDGTTENPVRAIEYMKQWKSVANGSALEASVTGEFDLNKFPVLCLYNLGSFLNPNEIPKSAARGIFRSIQCFPGIKKVIIESRAEYITPESLANIRGQYDGIIEVGIGLESSRQDIRELCHHKNMPDLTVYTRAIQILHENGCRALTYVNQKPPFLTEKEAITDAVETALFALQNDSDAVSVEPTSLQRHSLTDMLYNIGLYRVPWLWSVIEVVKGVYGGTEQGKQLDLRLGGYFDEQVLSGSQGVAPGVERNELFPHMTSGNCSSCTSGVIEAIKEFNRTYNPTVLYSHPICPACYPIWQDSMQVTDSRTIPRRIIDTLQYMTK